MAAVFIVFLPLLASLIVGVSTRSIGNKAACIITSLAVSTSALLAALVFYQVATQGQVIDVSLLRFIDSKLFSAGWNIKVDVLTAVMLVVVCWVSAAVHIYSIGYMSHDAHVPRFMCYLSLFTFFMLVLVTSSNLLQLFVGWEGVGLCSYLLIGFWYKKPSACAAAMKAFIVNRVGDFGFLLGIFAVFMIFKTLDFETIFAAANDQKDAVFYLFGQEYHAITVACILLFIGAMGKSAQLGLHTWLPDAMEGPTPVSALIHAATMVTAGVFLVARCSPLFELSPFALQIVTYVGAATAIFAATIAITQNDIKRVIAYSTCSQLGYMFFACGVSAYSAGIFHLMTHGFFKALLFLGAGSVIHALSDEQDMRKMGGVWKQIPITYALMWIGSLALVGIFPFAGFYSKDIVLEAAYVSGSHGQLAYWVGILAATLTAFYSGRLIFMTFHGRPHSEHHPHESPPVMLWPLYVLAIGAIFSGVVSYYSLGMVSIESGFWQKSITVLAEPNPIEEAHHVAAWVKYLPLVVGIFGLALSYLFYLRFTSLPLAFSKIFAPIYHFFLNKWYIDELYNALFVIPAKKIGKAFWRLVDMGIIDRFGPNGSAWISVTFAGIVSRIQNGYVYTYALIMLLGLIGFAGWYLLGGF